MADITVSNDVDALMRSADNEAIRTSIGVPTPEEIMNPLVEGQGLLNSFVGSAAAYSLRDLNKTNPDVIEVRRGSDETSRVFKANEIGSTLENWVNAEVALPLDTASGAAAAYSLRDLSVSRADLTSSGDTGGETTGALVAQVRRSSDSEIKSFTAAEVAGGSLETWVNTGVVQYTSDFSAGVDGWTESRATLLGNVDSIGGQDDNLQVTVDTASGGHYAQYPSQGDGTFTLSADVYIPSGNANVDGVGIYLGADLEKLTSTTDSWVTITKTGLGLATETMRVQAFSGAAYSFTANGTDVYYVRNVTITQTTAHGHVTKWYDQSGNDNHAVQATPASQPKVVEGGVLLAEGLKFDGGQMLDIPTSWDIGNLSSFLAAAVPIVGGNNVVLDLGNQAQNLRWIAPWDNVGTRRFGYADNGSVIAISASSNTTLYTAIAGSTAGGLNGFANGVLQGTASLVSGTPSGTQRIGARYDGGYPFTGTIPELIIYDSDQSDNRKAIESNMADYHGNIDLPAGFDSGNNEVDGYVAMWYDQSGNGNNAVQAVATSQPKIVEGGDLVADGLKFDGNGQSLELPTAAALGINGTNPKSFFSKATITASEQLIILGSNASTGAAIRLRAQAQGLTRIEVQGGGIDGGSALGSNGAVISSIFNGTQLADFDISSNGVITNSTSTLAINTADTSLHIGYLGGGLSEGLGQVEELIIYDSDQSLVRKSIEFNINNAYSIY